MSDDINSQVPVSSFEATDPSAKQNGAKKKKRKSSPLITFLIWLIVIIVVVILGLLVTWFIVRDRFDTVFDMINWILGNVSSWF
ncbi:MAG: hypothetical protein LBP91_00635 [Coriobacteriales bacterium]|nr:hypothetical protein [Coriobacteriales bacterium]